MMIISWAITRLYVLPLIIYSLIFDQIPIQLEGREPRWLLEWNCGIFIVVLSSIFVLSIWWYYIFMIILYNLIAKGETEDK